MANYNTMPNPFEQLDRRLDIITNNISQIQVDLICALQGCLPKRQPATRDQACEFLQCNNTTLYRLTKSGQLKSIKIGKSVRYDWDDLEAFVDQQKGA